VEGGILVETSVWISAAYPMSTKQL